VYITATIGRVVAVRSKEIAAVIKPAGLPMHEGGRYHKNTFVNMLPKYLGPGWTHVHRLDRETSGVVLCAKTAEMRAKLTEHWSQRQVEKTYLAITTSKPELNHWHINQPILKERHLRTNRAELSPDGDEAFTEFTVLSSGVEESLIAAKPLTGRTNQIRLHLNASNLCLVGEKLYGVNPEILEIYRKEGNTMRVQEMAGFSRHALHCWKLKFRHPGNNQVHECVAPLADDLVDLCKKRGVPYINL